MQPQPNINPSAYNPRDHRTRLCHVLGQLSDEHLRFILNKYLQRSSLQHKFQHYSREHLLQQCSNLIETSYSNEIEQTIYALRQTPTNYQTQINSINQQNLRFNNNNNSNNTNNNVGNYRYAPHSPAITQQLRSIRPGPNSLQVATAQNLRAHIPQQNSFNSPVLSQGRPTNPINIRFQTPILPPPPPPPLARSSSSVSSSGRVNPNKVSYKSLPFYQPIACVYERYHVFQYDQYRKQYMSHDEFLLSVDVCNQLALSYDLDLRTNTHKTSKCLILRLARIDQPPSINGKYDDNLPPNLVIHINGHTLSNLPTPKPCTRQFNDLVRIGREIDITSNCMFNPMLKNEMKMAWSYRSDNTSLHQQYFTAQYALNIYLVEHLTCEDLCRRIRQRPVRFSRDDLIEFLNKIHANDRDLGLEVSDQKLKLTCPIDQRRLKIPIRATTCQHLQCFDLINYITLNEKSNKWTCPVCNKYAFFEDLQIDTYMQSILNSIDDQTITEIIINSELAYQPVLQSKNNDEQPHRTLANFPSTETILIDDDDE